MVNSQSALMTDSSAEGIRRRKCADGYLNLAVSDIEYPSSENVGSYWNAAEIAYVSFALPENRSFYLVNLRFSSQPRYRIRILAQFQLVAHMSESMKLQKIE